MKIDLNEIPLIDNHCHPFPASRNPSYFERLVTLSLLPQKTESVRSTIVFQMFCNALRVYFGLDMNTPTEELIAYREKRVAEDRIQYFKDGCEPDWFSCGFWFSCKSCQCIASGRNCSQQRGHERLHSQVLGSNRMGCK